MGVRAVALHRSFFDRPAEEVAPELLGRLIDHETPEGTVTVRLTEMEAYAGRGEDPASHAYRGRTTRNAAMFGPPGHAYVYFTYGMHFCSNLVCREEGTAAAVLLRAGRVVGGVGVARLRRPGAVDRDLARGPARLTRALGIDRERDGADVCGAGTPLRLRANGTAEPAAEGDIATGPRTGVTAGPAFDWRFFVDGDPTVSQYRRARNAW